jgi:signal transduction histidine kinase
MEQSAKEIVYFILTVTAVILLLVVAIVSLLLVSRNRRLKHSNEILTMNAEFQQELNQTKHEVMELVWNDVSTELHDNVGQTLTLALLNLNQIKENDYGQVMVTREIISQAMQEIRDVSHMLSKDYWTQFTLKDSLALLEQQLQKLKSIKTSFTVPVEINFLGKDKEILVFRVIQELVNNSLKHAKANSILLNINYSQDNLSLDYSDNGTGLMDQSLNKSPGLGLNSIKTRMELCSASWKINREKGEGFHFEALIPIRRNSNETN